MRRFDYGMDNRNISKITVVGSGSSGNSYILDCGDDKLIIELGVDIQKVFKVLDYDIDNVVGCLVTHIHKDHSAYITHALRHALPIYSCEEVVKKYKQVNLLKLGEKVQIGRFKVQPIEVPHSCQCYAYLIEHNAIGRMLFATDCKHFCYKIKNLNHIFIEANWDEELVVDSLCRDEEIRSRYCNHMEIQSTLQALRNNFNSNLQNICLIHLSGGNANPKMFKDMVRGSLGFDNVFIADKGVEIPLQLSEF